MTIVLEVKNLHIYFQSKEQNYHAVRGVDFQLFKGETIGIVGESGCGKSALAKALVRLLPPHCTKVEGEVSYCGANILSYSDAEIRKLRGKELGIIFQDPMTFLNPTMKVGEQIMEGLHPISKKEVEELVKKMGIRSPGSYLNAYPHTLSGGMRQRALIALALIRKPKILIADEPTTALDAAIQTKILKLIKQQQQQTAMSILLITHDIGLAMRYCDKIIILYAGKVVEIGKAKELLLSPKHPYTQGLLNSILRDDQNKNLPLQAIPGSPPLLNRPLNHCSFIDRCPHAMQICMKLPPDLYPINESHKCACFKLDARAASQESAMRKDALCSLPIPDEIVKVARKDVPKIKKPFFLASQLKKSYPNFTAIQNISFEMYRGETLGLIGESGSGKTTLAKCLLYLEESIQGGIWFEGKKLDKRVLTSFCRWAQIIFQNPYASLNPRMTAAESVAEPLHIHRLFIPADIQKEVSKLFESVGLSRHLMTSYPYELSGGQRQRIAIARALALKPSLLICDEPLSALDVSVQAQIVNLLRELQKEYQLTYLFISHDLNIIKYISDRTAIMHQGQIVEIADTKTLFADPKHQATKELLGAFYQEDLYL